MELLPNSKNARAGPFYSGNICHLLGLRNFSEHCVLTKSKLSDIPNLEQVTICLRSRN